MSSHASNRVQRLLQLIGIVLFVLPALSSAAVVRWTFNNVQFADGGTVTGYFDYEANSQAFLDRSIAIAGGDTNTYPPLTYTPTNSFVELSDSPPISGQTILFRSNASTRFVAISILGHMGNGGGTLAFANTGDYVGHECYNCNPFRTINGGASITGVVRQFTLNPGITGNWYDPAQNGHGFQFEVLDGGIVTMFWFTFDNFGNQAWIGGAGTIDGGNVKIDAARVTNGRFPPSFNPNAVNRPVWGTLNFTFADCDHAAVTWNSVDPAFTATGTMSLVRLTKISGMTCS